MDRKASERDTLPEGHAPASDPNATPPSAVGEEILELDLLDELEDGGSDENLFATVVRNVAR